MFGRNGDLPKTMFTETDDSHLSSLDQMLEFGSDDEAFNVLMGYNLGNPTWAADVKLSQFVDWSDVANDIDRGEVSQRKLDPLHAKSLSVFMLKGLLNAAIMRHRLKGQDVPVTLKDMQEMLGSKPYCALQPIVANIRAIDPNKPSIRAERATTKDGNTVGFRVYMPRTYRWWVVDGQHRRFGAEMLMSWLKEVTRTGRYPVRGAIADFKGDVPPEHLSVWMEALSCAHTFATIKVEFHLGLDINQERQLFHDLNNLGKRINISMAADFDQGNPVNSFVRESLEKEIGIKVTEVEPKDWQKDDGSLMRKDVVNVNAIAFLNKTNAKSVLPSIVSERKDQVKLLWQAISKAPHFGEPQTKLKSVITQTAVLKALGKLTYDLLFSNRRPANSEADFAHMIENFELIDFSHNNPMWRFYELTVEERQKHGLIELAAYLPNSGELVAEVNRDIGSYQGGLMRFGSKHNDIFPVIADMIRWKLKLPNRHAEKLL